MRLRRGLAAAALIGASSVAAPAAAQYVEGRGSLTAAAGYNQIIADRPDTGSPIVAGPSLSLSPQASLIYETPRTNNVFAYAFTLNVPFTRGVELYAGPLSYGNRFAYSGRYQLSELSSLAFACGLNHGPLQVLAGAADASQTQLDPVPAGTAYVLGVSAQESFSRQLSEVLSLTQANAFAFSDPIDPGHVRARTVAVQNSLSLDRTFTVDTVGIQLAVASAYFTASEAPTGGLVDPHLQIASTLSLTWSRQITEALGSSLMAGVTYVASPGQRTRGVVQPTGMLSLSYQLDPAVIVLSLAHQAVPSLAAGSVSFTDSGTLRFSVPFVRTGLLAAGSGGFAHLQPIGDATGVATNVLLADASLTWFPRAVPVLSLGLRGQAQRQLGGLDGALTRLGATFNVTVSYPRASAAMMTPTMPPALGAAAFAPSTSSMEMEPPESPSEPAD